MTASFIVIPTTQSAQLIARIRGGCPFHTTPSSSTSVHPMMARSLGPHTEPPLIFERRLANADDSYRELRHRNMELPIVPSASSRRRSNRWMPSPPNFQKEKFLLHSHSREVMLDDESCNGDRIGVFNNSVIDASTSSHRVEKNTDNDDCASIADGSSVGESKSLSSFTSHGTTPSLGFYGIPVESIILLNLVAVIWGTQHAVIKTVVDTSSVGGESGGDGIAAYFTLARFGLAAALAAPYTPGWDQQELQQGQVVVDQSIDCREKKHALTGENKDDSIINTTSAGRLAWKYGAELGLYMFLGYAFEAIGLETTTASRSGFLLYLNVKFVPFLSYLILGRTIRRGTWISAFVAFLGTALLALDVEVENSTATTSTMTSALSVGDLWSIAAAASSAMFILRMESASKAIPRSSELNAATLWTVAAFSLFWSMFTSLSDYSGSGGASGGFEPFTEAFVHATQMLYQRTYSTISTHLIPLIYLSGITTALANFLQSKAQKDISAERASVIYAMDPVYGAIFANALLGETLGRLGLVGAFLIVVAAATNASMDLGGNGGVSGQAEEGGAST